MLSISEHADLHLGTRNMRQFHRATETFVLLRIIVLEADLELDSFEEVSLLGLERVFEKLLDVGTHSGCGVRMSVSAHDERRQVEWWQTYRL